jgi:hypothetical protein
MPQLDYKWVATDGNGDAQVMLLTSMFRNWCRSAPSQGLIIIGLKKHIRILEDTNLVTTEKVGRARECRLGSGELRDAARSIETYRRRWERRLDRLEEYIDRKKGGRE